MQLMGLLFVAGAITAVLPWLLGIGAVIAALWLLACWLEVRAAKAAYRERELDALRDRADEQHRWLLSGDDRGIYGEYTPAAV